MSDLLPCPFCGGEAEHSVLIGKPHRPETDMYWTWCTACNIGTDPYSTRDEAAAVWNRRTPPAAPTAWCPRCGLKHGETCEAMVGELGRGKA